jgi:hypothetical protein
MREDKFSYAVSLAAQRIPEAQVGGTVFYSAMARRKIAPQGLAFSQFWK